MASKACGWHPKKWLTATPCAHFLYWGSGDMQARCDQETSKLDARRSCAERADCQSPAEAFGQRLQRALRRSWAAALAAAADCPAALQNELMQMSPPSLNAQLLEPLAAGELPCGRHWSLRLGCCTCIVKCES